jgi:quinol monooxygenase YgiN
MLCATPDEGGLMYGVIVTVEIDAQRGDEARELLNTFTVPTVKQLPGFLSGTWMRSADGTRGRGVVLLESEDAANAMAAQAAEGPPEGAPVKFVSADVFEVLAQA